MACSANQGYAFLPAPLPRYRAGGGLTLDELHRRCGRWVASAPWTGRNATHGFCQLPTRYDFGEHPRTGQSQRRYLALEPELVGKPVVVQITVEREVRHVA